MLFSLPWISLYTHGHRQIVTEKTITINAQGKIIHKIRICNGSRRGLGHRERERSAKRDGVEFLMTVKERTKEFGRANPKRQLGPMKKKLKETKFRSEGDF